jgi:hypothetical protein
MVLQGPGLQNSQFLRAANEFSNCGRIAPIVPMFDAQRRRPERWKIGGQLRVDYLPDVLGLPKIPQLMLAQIAKRDFRYDSLPHQNGRCGRDQNLATVRSIS